MAFFIIFGGLSFSQMGISQMPDVDIPTVTISANYPGAAAEVMNVEVVQIIEGAISGIQGVTRIRSSSRTASSNITVEFKIDKNLDVAVEEIQNALAGASRNLPKDMEPVFVRKSNADSEPLLFLAINSDGLSKKELMALVRDQVLDSFSTIPGVSEVNVFGYQKPNTRVWLDSKLLAKNELTALDVASAIELGHIEVPSGQLENAQTATPIRTTGEFTKPEELAQILIHRRGGQLNYRPIKLGEVAKIEDGLENEVRALWSNMKPALGLAISKQAGSNTVNVAHAVKERVKELQQTLPAGTQLIVRGDTSVFIEESINELYFSLMIAALLTALICLLFLASWTATFNIILSIPTSIIGAFLFMNAFGFTLNFFTMLALILAIGIVVDDSIMVLENIVRYREMGESRVSAARIGAKEITLAATAATFAVIAIYLPVAFMQGIIGRYLFQFGVTLSIAVLLSLLEALTLTPMRCAQFLSVSERKGLFSRMVSWVFTFLAKGYKKAVLFVLRFRVLVTLLGIGLFVASLQILPLIKQEFVPPQDQSRIRITFNAPYGSSLEYTNGRYREIEHILKDRKEIKSIFAGVGQPGNPGQGFIGLELKPKNERPINPKTLAPYTQQELIPILRRELKNVKDMRLNISDPSINLAGFGRGKPIEFSILGPDYEKLVSYSQEIMKQMQESPALVDVDTDEREGFTELHLEPNRKKAELFSVPISEIALTVQATMSGIVVGQLTDGNFRNDIRIQVPSVDRQHLEGLRNIQIRNTRGELIPLMKLVDAKEYPAPFAVTRENRARAVNISANLGQGFAQAEGIEKVNAIAAKVLPQPYRIAYSGLADTFQNSFRELLIALMLGVIVSYMFLASQFNSFIHPFTVLIALPFSASGALIALYWGGQTLNIYSMIALLLLMGIVKKNAILLVDFTNRKRMDGFSVKDALAEACPVRLRPILMTSIATIAAAVPPALAAGPGAESRIPMAIAVIGGIIVSTLMTLFVVPSVYSLLSHLERKSYGPDM